MLMNMLSAVGKQALVSALKSVFFDTVTVAWIFVTLVILL
jgi:hypothetical protein